MKAQRKENLGTLYRYISTDMIRAIKTLQSIGKTARNKVYFDSHHGSMSITASKKFNSILSIYQIYSILFNKIE